MCSLTNQFAKPSWLNISKFKAQRWKLWIALVVLLFVYLIKWGFSTERAIYCLVYKQRPTERWIDHVALWPELPIITIVVSLLVLWYVQGMSFFRLPRGKSDWGEIACVGLVWASPLLLTRFASLFLPGTPCPSGSTEPRPFWDLSQLRGPAEEVWFAAAIAVWMLLWTDRPRIKCFGILVGGGLLRGIFHVYQGLESIGLFIWGAAAALAVALTGRWVLLFLMHYLNNALITAFGWDSIEAARLLLLVCVMLCGCSKLIPASKNRMKKPHAGALKSD